MGAALFFPLLVGHYNRHVLLLPSSKSRDTRKLPAETEEMEGERREKKGLASYVRVHEATDCTVASCGWCVVCAVHLQANARGEQACGCSDCKSGRENWIGPLLMCAFRHSPPPSPSRRSALVNQVGQWPSSKPWNPPSCCPCSYMFPSALPESKEDAKIRF